MSNHRVSGVEILVEPSAEVRRLRRVLEDSPLAGVLRSVFVAPYAQLSFHSFDFQMYLFDVFHTSWISRAAHTLGMVTTNLAIASLLAAWGGPWLAAAYVTGLAVWYARVAREVGLPGWFLAMVPVLGVVGAGGAALQQALPSTGPLWILLVGSAVFTTLPHALEPMMPPRIGDDRRWVGVPEFVVGTAEEPVPWTERPRRVAWLVAQVPLGAFNELWASPRLMPYTVLRWMLALGYRPDLKATLDARCARVWASGDPALDWVGTGGGTTPSELADRAA